MSMSECLIKEKKYDTVESFIAAISYKGELYNLFSNNHIFRGIASNEYELIPSALRKEREDDIRTLSGFRGSNKQNEYDQIQTEYSLLKKFFVKCDYNGYLIPEVENLRSSMVNKIDVLFNNDSWLPEYLFEIAALAQHYGIPTRLLDWSQDIFVAIYFATIGAIKSANKNGHMVLWALNSQYLDTCRYTDNMHDFPLKIIIPRYYGNPNLEAQKGVFTLWEISVPIKSYKPYKIDLSIKINRDPLDKQISNYLKNHDSISIPCLHKIMIPSNEAKELYKYLKTIKYDASRLFPGYSGIAKCIEDDSIAF